MSKQAGPQSNLAVGKENVHPRVEPLLKNLDRAQSELLSTADTIPAEAWKRVPREGSWSAGEIIAHLIMVERGILSQTDRKLQEPPERVPFLKRFHLPMAMVEARLIRRKTPMQLDPSLLRTKEEMLAELREVRGRTRAFLEETNMRDLSSYRWPHPFLGAFNVYDWVQFIASHEIRHTKQIQEIAANLQNAVASSQK